MRLEQVFAFVVIVLAIYLGVQARTGGTADSALLDRLRSGGVDGGAAIGDGAFAFDELQGLGGAQTGATPDDDDHEDAGGSRAGRDDAEDADGSGAGRDDTAVSRASRGEVDRRVRAAKVPSGPSQQTIVTSRFCVAVSERSRYDDLGTTHDAAIRCVVEAGIMTGTSATQFDPRAALTRGQAAAAIAAMVDTANRLEADNVDLRGLPSADDARFEDVTPATPHEMAIARLNETPILRGYVDARYEPSGKVTRAQMASMLDRTYQYVNRAALPLGADQFTDDDRSVHEESINAVAGADIMHGVTERRFAPNRSVRRGEMASYLARMMVRMEDKGRIRPLPAR